MTNTSFHIVQIIPNDSGGGAERIVSDLSHGLTERGYSVECVYFTGVAGSDRNRTWFGLPHDSLLNIQRLRRLIKERQLRHPQVIVHSHLTHGFYFTMLACSFLDVIWVHTEHNTSTRLRKIKALRRFERVFYNRCDQVVVISNGVKISLHKALNLSEKKVVEIKNGARFFPLSTRPTLRDRRLRMVSVGSLNERKGFHTFLKALAISDIGEWSYDILGEGNYGQSLKDLAKRLNIGNNVHFVGYVDDPRPYLDAADLQIIPSEWEGFGLVAVEGMSTGLRIVASSVDGLREVVGGNSDFCTLVKDHKSPDSWRDSLECMVKKLRSVESPTSTASRERAQQFSVQDMVLGYERLYSGLISLRKA